MAVNYEITDKRGPELADEILGLIESPKLIHWQKMFAVEENGGEELSWNAGVERLEKGSAWNQGAWTQIFLNRLSPGATIEPIEQGSAIYEQLPSYWRDEKLAILNTGVNCGTTACFAGWACTLAGDRPIIRLPRDYGQELETGVPVKNVRRWLNKLRNTFGSGGTIHLDDNDVSIEHVVTPDGKVKPIPDRAQELLGLTLSEREVLFAGGNRLPILREYVAKMRQGRNIVSDRKK